MRRTMGVMVLLGALSLAVGVPGAAAQYNGSAADYYGSAYSYPGGGSGYSGYGSGYYPSGSSTYGVGSNYGPGMWAGTWYGPFAMGQGSGPYGGIGATGIGSTGFGCGMGAYGFSNYGYGTGLGLGVMGATCGGFGNWPYLYPYYTGYPYSNAVGPLGGLALASLGNQNPFFALRCGGLGIGGNFPGQLNGLFAGPAGQYNLAQNASVLNLTSPALSTISNFGTFAQQGLSGCVQLQSQ